jgi:hypothetical protein
MATPEWEEFGAESYWKPDVHDVLEGMYLSRATEPAFEEGKTQEIARIEAYDGVIWRMAITAGLTQFFDRHAMPGDDIKLEYIGKQRSKKGHEFKAYRTWRGKRPGEGVAVSDRHDHTDYGEHEEPVPF